LVTVTEKWRNEFAEDMSAFEALWNAYGRIDGKLIGKVGNKNLALKMYVRAIKVANPTVLIEAAIAYTKNCHQSKTFIKNCSSWLNPEYKYWEDELPEIAQKEEKKPIINEVNNFMDGAKK